ncbi:ABC transporter substrate-binding protein [uncultured Paracoccus sp.]|uniref:ABC transporter substrate-binding protein n=1 Tax=uncultured Paracoccus sp. TaxID=189685 RepID=UPI00262ADA07|nr:ABC transporter substrate-binding protein [uncultured Paracoccus sp.]
MQRWHLAAWRGLLAFGLLAGLVPFAEARQLRILTSMPPALTDPFIAGFRKLHPEADLLVLNKNTNAGIDEIARGNGRGFDIFWASSPEAFAVIGQHQGFDATDCPALDGSGHASFALSSIGWARRADAQVFMPGDWDDLLLPAYHGRIGMALPSHSGTTHMLVERLLQVRGWDEGWRYFLRLTENLSTLTARSFGVIDGVKSGRFDIGLTIDFLAGVEPELDFRYGKPVMIFPAQIGRLARAMEPALACDFVGFVLSDEGQQLLMQPGVGRIPVSDRLRAEAGTAIPAPMQDAIRHQWQTYDAALAAGRYWAVNAIFDIFISDQLPRRRDLWARLRALRGQVPAAELAAVEALLTTLPLSEHEADRAALNSKPGRISDLMALAPEQEAAQERWAAAAAAQLDAIGAGLAALERRAARRQP